MTVREMIAALSNMPMDANVSIPIDNGDGMGCVGYNMVDDVVVADDAPNMVCIMWYDGPIGDASHIG